MTLLLRLSRSAAPPAPPQRCVRGHARAYCTNPQTNLYKTEHYKVQNTDGAETNSAAPADYCAINNNDATKQSAARGRSSPHFYLKLVLPAAATAAAAAVVPPQPTRCRPAPPRPGPA